MPDKLRKTASDLKLIIEEELRAGHLDCERAEVIIKPADGGSWSAAIFGQGPTIDQQCRSRLDEILDRFRNQFDLA